MRRRPLSLLALTLPAFLLAFVNIFAQRPELLIQTGHNRVVISVALSADGRILASKSDDGTILIWEVATGRQLQKFKGGSTQDSIALSADGRILVGGGGPFEIKLWDVTTGEELRTLQGKAGLAFSLALSPNGKLLAAAERREVQLWDVATGQEMRTLTGHSNDVHTVAFGPDNLTLASGSEDKTVKLWDIASGRALRTLKGHSAQVSSVAFSGDGKILASGSWDHTIVLWDPLTGRKLRTLTGHSNLVLSVALSGDGATLASGGEDKALKLWNVATGLELHTLTGHDSIVSTVALDAAGKILVSGSWDYTARLWDVTTGRQLRTFGGHSYQIFAVAFSPDDKTLALGRYAGGVKLWGLVDGPTAPALISKSGTSNSLIYSADGKTLISAGSRSVDLWDISKDEPRLLRSQPDKWAKSLSLSRDGKILAWASEKAIKLWDLEAWHELQTLPAQTSDVQAVALSTDGTILASCTRKDELIKLWDVASGRELRSLHGYFSALAFSGGNKILAAGGFDGVTFWEVATGRKVRSLGGDSVHIGALAFTSDEKIVAGAVDDGTIKLWDSATGRELHTLKGHADEVTSLAFNRDGTMLASGSNDYTARLWDVAAGTELVSLIAVDQTDWLVVTPDGLFDGSSEAWNRILWRFSKRLFDVDPVEAFFSEFYYPGLLTDILAGKRPHASSNISQKDRRQPQLKLERTDGQSATPTASRTVKVRLAVSESPAGAQDVRLFRNGSLVKVWHGDVLHKESAVTLEATIPITAGENRLTAYAFNRDNIKSGDATLTINGAASLKRKGVAYVLAVGVNSYANPQYDLHYAVADAQAFGLELKAQQTKIKAYEHVEVISLNDGEATKARILQALFDLATRIQPEDALVVFFAGHGTAHQNRFYLIPHDLGYAGNRTRLDNAGFETILAHSISDEEIAKAVEGIDTGQFLLVIDACNSGQALEAEEKRRGPMNSKGLAQLAYEKGMYILTAAQSYQAAQEAAKLGHGLLTYALVVEGLEQAAADIEPQDGTILLREWLDFAAGRVPEMQLDEMKRAQGRGINLSFAEDERTMNVDRRSGQRPRVFYRREVETSQMVIAKPGSPN